MTVTHRLIDTCIVFITFWIGTRLLSAIAYLFFPHWLIANPSVHYATACCIGFIAPTLLHLRSVYEKYLGNPYLTADYFKAAKDRV